ncbi:MAG: outer membrane protein assembly factor BamB family protein [Pirellulales bacterium]
MAMTRFLKRLPAILAAGGLAAAAISAVLAAAGGASQTLPSGAAADSPSADRPVGWRGDGSGRYPAARPAIKWSATENVRWKAEVGAGHSSPIIVGGRVLVAAEPDVLLCLDAATGKQLWRKAHKLADLPAQPGAKAPAQRENYGDATPTPVSDGRWAWAVFNTGIVACHDLEGTSRWTRWYDMRLATGYGRTASPVLVGQRLLVHFGPLACLDAATGKVLWQNDLAKAAYGTPAAARIGDVDVVVTPKGQIVRVADGKILASGLGPCGYTSPVVADGVVYFIDRDMSAVALPKTAGEKLTCKELWYEPHDGDFYASPVIHEGRVYAVDRAANFYVIDAATGKTVLTKVLPMPSANRAEPPNVYPSICLAGTRLVVGNDAGECMLLELGDKADVVALNSLPGGSGATPAFCGQSMYLRAGKFLYCIGTGGP